MNQLFLITWRWLKRDKKRTALTLASIILSVFLISFVGVYMSTALNAFHASREYDEPQHATLYLESMEQARMLDKNAAWESHMTQVSNESFILGDFMKKYSESDKSCFPLFSINGLDVFSRQEKGDINAVMLDGDVDKLMPQSCFSLTGELPRKPHEVAVSHIFAAKYGGLEIGDTLTIRYDVRSGTLYAATIDEENRTGYTVIRDENGEIIYTEDADGQRLRDIYSAFFAGSDHYSGKASYFSELLRVENGEEPVDRVHIWINDMYLPPAYAVLSDEVVESFEYTATVTGFTDSGSMGHICDMAFYIEDSDILPFFESSPVFYGVRVKKGIDAEEAVVNALKGLGYEREQDIVNSYYLNVDLLQLEGRQLEYLDNLASLLLFTVVVMALFMFLARLIINNAFEISAAYRTEQYGALKTIGASDRQLFTMIMFECGMYMLIALPLGMGSAVLVGKAILQKIRDIKVFDPIYGDGVSDRFFTLELSPFVMWLTFGCALFSVFFSAYADAMRVRHMPPIQSVGYRSSKRRIWNRSLWLSRRFFGYPFGFAVKCISKQKVRFAVTLLASVISGILIMTLTTVVKSYSDREAQKAQITEVKEDMQVWLHYESAQTPDEAKAQYDEMMDTGMFDEIYMKLSYLVKNDIADERFYSYINDDYKALFDKHNVSGISILIVYGITRDQYEKYIETDISYDELAASGKVLLCKSVCESTYDERERQEILEGQTVTDRYKYRDEYIDFIELEPFNTDDITALELTGSYSKENENGLIEDEIITNRVEVAGFYTTRNAQFACYAPYIYAIMPVDSFSNDRLESTKAGYDEPYGSPSNGGYIFFAKEDRKVEARGYLTKLFGDLDIGNGIFEDYTGQNAFEANGVRALKIAGFGFAGALAAVVLLNIFSTMSANMINRRRDLNMMRSCGMSMRQVRRSLFIESSFYAVITTVISTIAGWVIGIDVISLLSNERLPQFEAIRSRIENFNISSFPWLECGILYAVIMLTMAAAYLPGLAAMKRSNIAQEIRTDL